MNGWAHASAGRKLFIIVNAVFLIAICLTMIVPLWNALAVSFMTDLGSMQWGIHLWPKVFSLSGYITVWNELEIWRPFVNSVYVTLVGTLLHVLFSSLAGYVLIHKNLPGNRLITTFIIATMVIPFEAIMIPVYITMRQLGLIDTFTALILSGMVSGFSILIMRNFFLRVPSDIVEQAVLDGAGSLTVFTRVFLPLSKAGLATIALFEFVGRWNNLTSTILFINNPNKYTLQVALNTLVTQSPGMSSNNLVTQNVRMAGIILAIIPLLLAYPFVQKYFVKGIFLGSTKE